MVSIAELKQRFPVRDCPPYGTCIVIPGKEYDPDWTGELDVDPIETDFGDHSKPFTLIRVNDESPAECLQMSGDAQVANLEVTIDRRKDPTRPKRKPRSNEWDPKDAQRLIKR
jgi:hypothetical protein